MLLRSKTGLSLLEILLTLLVGILIISAVLGVYKQRIQQGRIDQMINDMNAIADAALNYNNSTESWPASLADLAPGYLPALVSGNAFGNPYVLSCMTGKVSVSSKAPAGLVQNTASGSLLEVSAAGGGDELVTITKRERIGALGRLKYDKEYIYHE